MVSIMNSKDPTPSGTRPTGPVVREYESVLELYKNKTPHQMASDPGGRPSPWPGGLALAFATDLERSVILINAPKDGYLHDRGDGIGRPVWGLEVAGDLEK